LRFYFHPVLTALFSLQQSLVLESLWITQGNTLQPA
jgi:hypothetical protein